MPLLRPSGLLASLVILASCGGGSTQTGKTGNGAVDDPIAGDICEYRDRQSKTFAQALKFATGGTKLGELTPELRALMVPKFGGNKNRSVATALARARRGDYRVRIDGNCYDANTRTYYACTKVVSADLSKIRALARASTMAEARRFALTMCESLALREAEKVARVRQSSFDTRCRIAVIRRCAPPPEPKKKAPAGDGKKKSK